MNMQILLQFCNYLELEFSQIFEAFNADHQMQLNLNILTKAHLLETQTSTQEQDHSRYNNLFSRTTQDLTKFGD